MSDQRPIDLVLSKLQDVKHRRDGIWACCPAHPDENPSMKVWESEDGACCVKCHSNHCTTEQIMHAIGLTAKDRFLPREKRPRPARKKPKVELGQELRSHWYHDELGDRAHVAIKFEGGWRQKHWDGKSLHWGLEGVKTYLFRLPELMEAVAQGKEIWITEGEKDADRVNRYIEEFGQHAFATTNPMGGMNWKPSYTNYIRGCKVVLVRDPDETGFKRSKHLFTELTSGGCQVRVVQAANIDIDDAGEWIRKDAFDHMEDGGTLESFEIVDPYESWKKSGFFALKVEQKRRQAIARGETPAETPETADSGADAPPPGTPVGDGEDPGDRWYPWDEFGNCRRLLDRYGRDLHWVPHFGKWIVWDGLRWVLDETEGAPLQAMAVRVIRDLRAMVKDFSPGSDEHKALKSFIKASASKKGIDNMIGLAKREPGIAIVPEQLDADRWLCGCPNGTLDLRKGELREPRREDLITKWLGVAYDAEAKCNRFKSFLAQAFKKNKEVYEFFWNALGYTLTGSIKAECFFFLHGPGGGGKGTAMHMTKVVMGEYGKTLRAASLQAKNLDAIPQDIAKLKGARAAFIHETAENKRWDENLIKELTGGNEVTARFMRENEFEFMPEFKLWICGNHKPDIISFDRSWRRRIRLIPFEHIVPESDVNPNLKEELARDEAAGVLAEMVRYCVKWQSSGLPEAEIMREALKEYQDQSDQVNQFLATHCHVDIYADSKDGISVGAEALFFAFRAWAEKRKYYCGDMTWFGKDIHNKGFEKKRRTAGYSYIGIKLKTEEELKVQDEEFGDVDVRFDGED